MQGKALTPLAHAALAGARPFKPATPTADPLLMGRIFDRSWAATWRYVAGLGVIGFLLWFPFVRGVRVPLLWAADLGFHELGHMLAIPFGTTLHFLAGSTTQVLVPAGLAVYFWLWQRDAMASGVTLAWAASSAQDASVYIADAPSQSLPLIGGHHDWNYLLSQWQLLDSSAGIARSVLALGALLGVAAVAVAAFPLFRQWRMSEIAASPSASSPPRPTGPRRVREARFRRPAP